MGNSSVTDLQFRKYYELHVQFFKDRCISMEHIFLTRNWPELDIVLLSSVVVRLLWEKEQSFISKMCKIFGNCYSVKDSVGRWGFYIPCILDILPCNYFVFFIVMLNSNILARAKITLLFIWKWELTCLSFIWEWWMLW